MEEYRTILQPAQDEFVERKSRFIGHAMPVANEEEALSFITQMKQKYWDATHNVYAYILDHGMLKRYSDDGGPQGTAGIPVLDVLQKEKVTGVAVVVTRYFGGVLLGTGGLVRAYSHGAKIALDAAGVIVKRRCVSVKLSFDYAMYGKITYILPQYNALTLQSDFGASVVLKIMMQKKYYDAFCKEISELSGGTIVPQIVEELYSEKC